MFHEYNFGAVEVPTLPAILHLSFNIETRVFSVNVTITLMQS